MPPKITFKSPIIFGKHYKHGAKVAVCTVGQLLDKNIINTDGTLNWTKEHQFKKSEAWNYFYYLWYHNHATDHVPELHSIPLANAVKFLECVHALLGQTNSPQMTKKSLVIAINTLVSRNKTIHIPVLQNIYGQLIQSTNDVYFRAPAETIAVKLVPDVKIKLTANGTPRQQDQSPNVKVNIGMNITQDKTS